MDDGQAYLSDDEYLKALGRRIRFLRRALDLNQDQLAVAAGVSRTFVSGLERGRYSIELLRLRRLARALGSDLETLVHDLDRGKQSRDPGQ
jgi:XRE family transcriptional regulator, regulator of sulfur utilization